MNRDRLWLISIAGEVYGEIASGRDDHGARRAAGSSERRSGISAARVRLNQECRRGCWFECIKAWYRQRRATGCESKAANHKGKVKSNFMSTYRYPDNARRLDGRHHPRCNPRAGERADHKDSRTHADHKDSRAHHDARLLDGP